MQQSVPLMVLVQQIQLDLVPGIGSGLVHLVYRTGLVIGSESWLRNHRFDFGIVIDAEH